MDHLRCLYLENDVEDRERYSTWIEDDWKHFYPKVPISVESIGTLQEAAEKLKLDTHDLFVVDIYLGDEDSREGLRAIQAARARDPNVAIVALSIGNGGLEQATIDVGADKYCSKKYIGDKAEKYDLGIKMVFALKKHNKVPHITPLENFQLNPDDLALVALVNLIGAMTIVGLIDEITGRRSRMIVPFFVRPGLSGAAVLRLDCEIEVPAGDPPEFQGLLVKFSRSRRSLEQELNSDKRRFPPHLFVDFVSPLVESGDWVALAAPFQYRCKTLSDWVASAQDGKQIEQVLQNLFLTGGLKEVYSRIGRRDSERSISSLFSDALTPSRKGRVQKAMQDLGDLMPDHDPMKWFNAKMIENFIRAKQVDDLTEESFPMGASRCFSHGDLHGRNILIKQIQDPRAVLIDPANIGNLHWALDLARITADLAVSVIDVGRWSHEWERMKVWQEVIGSVIRGEQIECPAGLITNIGLFTTLNWVSANWQCVFMSTDRESPLQRWEFTLALACEFLRSSYREQELPSPKRVLALTAGCEALRETARMFRSAYVTK